MSVPLLPRIRCAVCDKLVDKVTVEFDPCLDMHRIHVRCHGDRDVMEISGTHVQDDAKFWRGVAEGKVEGIAFTTKRLSDKPQPHLTLA